ncbi:hypothetical protein BDR26DRAFT_921982 [Obelidium mucronatum]|nr:hypothetical protein BDR26DRAFT_921982 [Obelidium mucronatum]
MKVPLILLWCALSAHAFDMVLNRPGNTFTFFQLTLLVPPLPIRPQPGSTATYFLWPGLQPGFAQNNLNFLPIGNGVLQPVLSYGPSCIPNMSPTLDYYSTWIISGLYVNLDKKPTGKVCNGGEVLLVNPGDSLQITFQLIETTWRQTITLLNSNPPRSVHYEINLQNQTQGRAEINVELYHDATQYFPVTFKDISLRVSQAGDSGYCFNRTGTRVANLLKSESCSEGVLDLSGVGCLIGQCRFEAVAPVPEGAASAGGGGRGSSGPGSRNVTESSNSSSGSNSMGANGGTVVGNGSSAASPSKTSDSTRSSFVFRTIILYITTCILITS